MAGLFQNKTGRKTFVDATSTVLSLMGKEIYSIREGNGACTDTKGTIWLPPLPETATENDKIKYFCNAVHEEGHNELNSDTSLMSKVKMIHHYENCIDDIRIEHLQEKKYKGLIKYRIRDYEILADEFLKKRFARASINNLPEFLDTIGVYTIGKIRTEQMNVPIDWTPSKELNEAYNKYIRDLEPIINNHTNFNESLSIAHTIVERLKDLIKDAEEQKQQQKDKEKSDGKPSDSTKESKDSDDGNKKEIDIDTRIKELSELMEGTDLQSYVREQIEKNALDLYYVSPKVKDIIRENYKGSIGYANLFRTEGIKILGVAGAQITRYMVSHSRMRSIHNTRSGKIDMLSLNADAHDTRMNIYGRDIPGSLEKAAVSICIDHSNSMKDIINLAYRILSGLLHYLDKANVPSEAIGFTANSCTNSTCRDTPVILSIIKKFKESFRGDALKRCVPPPLNLMKLTSEIDCLKYAVPRLMNRKETKKILFVIGDGCPYLKNKELTIKNAIAYKQYLDLCKKAGIIVVGFGIDCDLSFFFGDDYVDIKEDTMGIEIANKLTNILNRKR